MVTEIYVFEVRKIAAGDFTLAFDADYRFRVFYRIRAQQEIESGKERRVHANAQTKSHDGNRRKARVLQQDSHAVAQISKKCLHSDSQAQARYDGLSSLL